MLSSKHEWAPKNTWNLLETRWSSNFTLKKQKLTSETNFYHAQGCTQYANKYHFAQWLLLGIFVRKVFDTNLNFRYQRVKKYKNIRALLLCQLQKLTTWWLYFFRFLTHWYLKLRFGHKFPKAAIVFKANVFNRSSRRKRGMASNPLFIIPDFFCIFQMNFGCLSLVWLN